MEQQLQARKKHLLEKNLNFQPIIIILGEDEPENCSAVYVWFDNIFQKFDTVLEALDFNFKLTHIYNIKYSEDCIQIYMFVQKYFYNITTNYDANIATPTTDSFISELFEE